MRRSKNSITLPDREHLPIVILRAQRLLVCYAIGTSGWRL